MSDKPEIPPGAALLVTADGGEIAQVLLPPFDPLPEILVWGQRTFVHQAASLADRPVYREGMTWVVPRHEVDRSTNMLCPEHGMRFAAVETMAAGGRRVCELGETWRVEGGHLTRA